MCCSCLPGGSETPNPLSVGRIHIKHVLVFWTLPLATGTTSDVIVAELEGFPLVAPKWLLLQLISTMGCRVERNEQRNKLQEDLACGTRLCLSLNLLDS